MRIYKINDIYIDLDHVLMVSELIFWQPGDDTADEAWFYITLAFRDKRKRIGFKYDYKNEDGKSVCEYKYNEFLTAWQTK